MSSLSIGGTVGQDIDFTDSRLGRGAAINVSGQFYPTRHLDLGFLQNQRWLDVDAEAGFSRRLFVARVSRVRAAYMFTANSFVRIIGQYVSTTREPSLYRAVVPARSGAFSGSALFAYKINWQSVLFVGYGDDRELSDERELEKAGRKSASSPGMSLRIATRIDNVRPTCRSSVWLITSWRPVEAFRHT